MNNSLFPGTPVGVPAEVEEPAPKPVAGKRSPKKDPPRKLTDAQVSARDTFTTWYRMDGYPRHNGGLEYPFDGAKDAKAVLGILRFPKIEWDVERAKAVALVYLRQPEAYGTEGHPLLFLSQRMHRFYAMAFRVSAPQTTRRITNGKATADNGRVENLSL